MKGTKLVFQGNNVPQAESCPLRSRWMKWAFVDLEIIVSTSTKSILIALFAFWHIFIVGINSLNALAFPRCTTTYRRSVVEINCFLFGLRKITATKKQTKSSIIYIYYFFNGFKNFLLLLRKLKWKIIKAICFSYVGKLIFLRKKNHLSKNPKFYWKNFLLAVFLLLKNKNVLTSIWKLVET